MARSLFLNDIFDEFLAIDSAFAIQYDEIYGTQIGTVFTSNIYDN